jgi:simple sugar transport system ATP-binding protein
MMVGRPLQIVRKERPIFKDKKPILELTDVCANDDRGIQALKNINLTVYSGEILGVAGVDGNGQRELAECIAGLRKITSGKISIDGNQVKGVVSDPKIIGFIPEDRQKTGLVMDFTIADNLIMKNYKDEPFNQKGVLNYSNIKNHAREMIDKYNIKTPSEDEKARNLSGGNQQKVVIARELNPEPKLDIAAHPTRGLDLGAVVNVHDTLLKERNRGAAVLFISAELQEIMALCDRIIVLFSGNIIGELDGESADQNLIGQMMLGQKPGEKE